MPRDKRLYMTFPIDIHRHPKMLRLPGDVKWTFAEMNGEARIANNDGVFSAEDAEYLWPIEHLDALVKSHPKRPLVLREGDTYIIREYAQHQQTVADHEAVAERARVNGSKGGRPRKNPAITQPVSDGLQSESHETQGKAESESESESKTLTDVNYLPEISPERNVPARGLPIDELALQKAKAARITDLASLHRTLSLICGGPLTPAAAVDLALAIAKRSKDPFVRDVDAYVAKACRSSPADVRWDYDRLDLGAA
jgi:hypothetical protein